MQQWHRNVLHRFRAKYGIDSLAEVVATATPGYWQKRAPCGGAAGGCRHPLHACLGNEGVTRHTMTYYDSPRDEAGRFASPYRTWRLAREEQSRAEPLCIQCGLPWQTECECKLPDPMADPDGYAEHLSAAPAHKQS